MDNTHLTFKAYSKYSEVNHRPAHKHNLKYKVNFCLHLKPYLITGLGYMPFLTQLIQFTAVQNNTQTQL